jgi:hypothetical protein
MTRFTARQRTRDRKGGEDATLAAQLEEREH